MSNTKQRLVRALVGIGLAVGLAPSVRAAGTDAGTDISNFATVDYVVGTVNQPDVTSNTVVFETDRKILLTVAEVAGSYTDVVPGETGRVLTFTVSNGSNTALDMRLTATHDTTGATDPFGATDDFNPNPAQVFVDGNSNGTYESGSDTLQYVDELAEDGTRTVFIVGDIPLGEADGNTAGLTLTAIAAAAGTASSLGADWTQTGGSETPGVVDTVFADLTGDTDADRDGQYSDDDAYRVQTATITVTKTSTVVSDPFNLTNNPKRIPGATIEYCIAISNSGSTDASTVVVSDTLTGQPVTFVPGTIVAGGAADCTGGTGEDDNSADGDEADPNGGNFGGGVVTVSVPTIAGGGTTTARFRVTIN
jgi:uncharacterized repeat protein (TIGR01451 family)